MQKLCLLLLLTISCISLQAQSGTQSDSNAVTLPNGWGLSPAGRSLPLGDLPLNMVLSKNKKLLAVSNNGQSIQSIQLIDPVSEIELDRVIISRSWYGLAFGNNDHDLYVGGGHDNRILVYAIENNKLTLRDSIELGKKWPNRVAPAGMALDEVNQILYVVTRDDKRLYTIDLATKKVTAQYALGGEAYTCVLSPNREELYISCWGCDKVYVFNTIKKNIEAEIPVGDNPNELLLNKKGDYLLVANSNDNSVSVIHVAERKVVETLNAALYADAPNGSTTNGMSFSTDEKTLYIANADNN
ncbi:MAG: YncE family protein, partial [Chitinophagia bacterium]|nr:YncE family protein [Chitinophagia bacterium]